MPRKYQVISADGHLEVPPTYFVDYIAEEHRDRAPRLIRLAEGSDAWIVEGGPLVNTSANLTGGGKVGPRSYTGPDGTPTVGAGSGVQRLNEQDTDGVDAEVLFPPIFATGALKGIASDDAYRAIVEAYNSFVAERVIAIAPDRLIAMAAIPNRGLDMAIAELRRCKDLGFKGVALSEFPSGKSNSSADDDPFWAAAVEIGMAVTADTHMGFRYPAMLTGPQPDAPPMAWLLTTRQAILAPTWNLAQLIVTGTFDRFPELRIYFAETNASWLPTALYQMDENYGIYEHQFEKKLAKLPSEYFRDHVLVSFIRDEPVADELDILPLDNLMWGSDFPHSVGSWPKSREWLDRTFAKSSDEVMRKILVETPARFFGLDVDEDLTPTPA